MNTDDSLREFLAGELTVWAGSPEGALRNQLLQQTLSASVTAKSAWYPHAGLMQLLLWDGQPQLVAELAERTIIAFAEAGNAATAITDEEFPFNDALLAERSEDPTGNDLRLARVASAIEPGSVLHKRLTWLKENLPSRPLDRLLSGYNGWDEPATALGPLYAKLASKFDKLSDGEVRRLWTGAYSAHDIELAHRLAARYGRDFPLWYVAAWFAGWQIRDGDIAGGQQTLLDAQQRFLPFAAWDLLPLDPVLQSTLMPAATKEFRQTFVATLDEAPPREKRR